MTIQYFSLFLVLATMGNQSRILLVWNSRSPSHRMEKHSRLIRDSDRINRITTRSPWTHLLSSWFSPRHYSSLVKHSTIITSEESLRDSKLPDTGYLRTKGQESVYEICACVIHTILLSYMCISIVSHFTLMFARGTCAS